MGEGRGVSKTAKKNPTSFMDGPLAKRDIIKRLGACDLMHEFENRTLKVRKSQKNFVLPSISPKIEQKQFLSYPLKSGRIKRIYLFFQIDKRYCFYLFFIGPLFRR